MAKEYPPDELADRTFIVGFVGVLAFIVAVFIFIL